MNNLKPGTKLKCLKVFTYHPPGHFLLNKVYIVDRCGSIFDEYGGSHHTDFSLEGWGDCWEIVKESKLKLPNWW